MHRSWDWIERRFGLMLAAWAAALLGILLVCLFFLAVLAALGGVRLDGETVDWEAVGALATIGATVATAGAAAALALAMQQVRTQDRDERVSRKPYLRVDLGFRERIGQARGFLPKEPSHYFSMSDLGKDPDIPDLGPLLAEEGEPAFTLTLWVTNAQSAPLGTAYEIQVECTVAWTWEATASEGRDFDGEATITVEFVYLEPGRVTGLELARLKRTPQVILANVRAVSYGDVFGGSSPRLSDHHGALEMSYSDGEVRNDRKFKLSR